MNAIPALSIVVPCFNEEGNIPTLLSRLTAASRNAVGDDYEIILIDDGSRDGTLAAIERAATDSHITGIALSRNFGHQRALSAGLAHARGAHILIIDADLQDPPELLPEMMRRMDEERAEVVYGVRIRRLGERWTKRVTAAAFYRLLNLLSDVPIPRDAGDFRLITRRILDLINAMPEDHRFVRGMIGWIGFRQIAFPYDRQERLTGTTHYPLRKMMAFAIDAITSLSIRPLRFASYLAFISSASALLLLLYAFAGFLVDAARGWISLMAVILLIGSAQLLVLGVIGEYFGRLYLQSRGRPLYIVDRLISKKSSSPAD